MAANNHSKNLILIKCAVWSLIINYLIMITLNKWFNFRNNYISGSIQWGHRWASDCKRHWIFLPLRAPSGPISRKSQHRLPAHAKGPGPEQTCQNCWDLFQKIPSSGKTDQRSGKGNALYKFITPRTILSNYDLSLNSREPGLRFTKLYNHSFLDTRGYFDSITSQNSYLKNLIFSYVVP